MKTPHQRAYPMKAAVYLRVSKSTQNPEHQRPECLALCKAEGWKPKVFIERESGRKDRKVWNDVVKRAVRGEFGAVVVWSVDRMGRNYYGIQDSFRDLDTADVMVATIKEPWILMLEKSPLRSLVVAILGCMAELEGRRIRERITAGLDTARRKGKRLGRPPVLKGPALAMAITLREKGEPWEAIRHALQVAGFGPDKKRKSKLFARGTVRSAVEAQGDD